MIVTPKETVHTEHGQTGVYVLTDDHLEWKQVTLGVSNTTRTEVNGLKEGEEVAISSDHALRNGLVVRAVVQ